MSEAMDFSSMFKPKAKRKKGRKPRKAAAQPGPVKQAEAAASGKENVDSGNAAATATDPTRWEVKESGETAPGVAPEVLAVQAGTRIPGKFMIHFRPHYGWLKRLKKPAVLKSCTCIRFAPTPFRPELCHCGYPEEMHPALNERVVRGWQQQRGNNCAAASIAGAANALMDIAAVAPDAATLEEAVSMYEGMLTETVEGAEKLLRKRIPDEFERISRPLLALDVGHVDRAKERRVLRDAFRAEVKSVEEEWTSEVERVLREAGVSGFEATASALRKNGAEGDDEEDEEALKASEEAAGDELPSGDVTSADETPRGEASDDATGSEAPLRLAKAAGEVPDNAADSLRTIHIQYQARLSHLRQNEEVLRRWWHKLWGRERLRAKRSTAVIGNMHILRGFARLVESRGGSVDCMTLMNKGKTKRGVVVKANDTQAAKDAQWSLICDKFNAPRTVLLFHLTNHYVLVFGVREYTDPDSGLVERHILTARAGQEPKTWLSWDQCRHELLKWQGYSMLCFERTD